MPYRKQPIVINETVGTKYYCACGESAKKPYCDGSHEKLKTGITPIEHEIKKPGKVEICDCGKTATPPFCDGSHDKR